jgi:hypothetical protein
VCSFRSSQPPQLSDSCKDAVHCIQVGSCHAWQGLHGRQHSILQALVTETPHLPTWPLNAPPARHAVHCPCCLLSCPVFPCFYPPPPQHFHLPIVRAILPRLSETVRPQVPDWGAVVKVGGGTGSIHRCHIRFTVAEGPCGT